MSAFRDDQEAALLRADALEDELARQRAENERQKAENERLREELGAARARRRERAEPKLPKETKETEEQRRHRVESEQYLERVKGLGMIGPDGAFKPTWWKLLLLGRPHQPRFITVIALVFVAVMVGTIVMMFV
jgi:hypothetical protein